MRAMLHAWEKYGHDDAEAEHYRKHTTKSRLPSKERPSFESIIRGHLAFFKSVKGEADPVYQNLVTRFNEVAETRIVVRDLSHMARRSTWIIEDENEIIRGTGFFLQNVGFVTCAHCVGSAAYIYRPDEPLVRHRVRVVGRDDDIDLAVLGTENDQGLASLVASDLGRGPHYHDAVILIGYPAHAPGREISIKRGEVVSFATKSGIRRFNISATIVAGNSGGPVLDKQYRVIGVAVTGADFEREADRTEDHGVIPIQALSHVFTDREQRGVSS
jgi:S1-C subfamily serine protease